MNISELPISILIDGDHETREVYIDGKLLRPEPSQKVWNHSPDGFNWGYNGSGPAQLALAILLKYLPQKEAVKYHQPFKFKVVGRWPMDQDFEEIINLQEIMKTLISISNQKI